MDRKEQGNFTIEIKRKKGITDFINLLFMVIWLVSFFIIFTGMIIGIVFTGIDRFNVEILLFFIPFSILSVLVLKIFLWSSIGKEIITIDGNELVISKKGTFLTTPDKYEIGYITDFSYKKDSDFAFFGISRGGHILFKYKKWETRDFGRTLSFSEASKIIENLQQAINLKCEKK